MSKTININNSGIKTALHPRNPHRFRYNFEELINSCEELTEYVSVNPYGDESVDFSDPDAVKILNRALLKHFYGISNWDIPGNYLTPPVPGRADYIHYLADLLGSSNGKIIPKGESVSVLDIGVGANCIYPIIGNVSYGWRFTGTDIDPESINSAQNIIDSNSILSGQIELRLQKNSNDILHGIIKPGELFDTVICNPPFHSSPDEAAAGTLRKLVNLNRNKIIKKELNFGGQNRELWTPGGEEKFIGKMINESSQIQQQCLWFTTLVSKKTTLPSVYRALKRVKAAEVRTIEMSQGQKISRIAAWSFLTGDQHKIWSSRWKK